MPNNKEYNIFACRIGKDDPSKTFLIFEFLIVFCRDNSPIEMSCGFAKINYSEISTKTAHKIIIRGGTPDNEQDISPEDVRTYRTG